MNSKNKIIIDSDGKIITDSKGDGLGHGLGHGLAICGVCGLIVAELYFKAHGWIIGWSIFALVLAL